jgi:hypothetical protein
MAQAHIGASPQNDAEVEALFHQAGVIRADTLEDLFDIALLLSHQPLPRGNRVAVVSNSGGVATICADACESHGMQIAGPGLLNLRPTATPEQYEQACQQALEDPEVDALIATFACVGACDPDVVARAIRRGALRAEKATGLAKPTLLSLMGVRGAVSVGRAPTGSGAGAEQTFPSYRFPEAAARALSKVVEYARFRMRPPGRILTYDGMDPATARRMVELLLRGSTPESPPRELKPAPRRELLGHFGLRLAEDRPEEPRQDLRVFLGLTVDPDFGPIWRFHRPGPPSVLRITPLTDLDIAGVLELLELPADCGLAETLGRLTQMVEELPWIHALDAEVDVLPDGLSATVPLPLARVFLSFAIPVHRSN